MLSSTNVTYVIFVNNKDREYTIWFLSDDLVIGKRDNTVLCCWLWRAVWRMYRWLCHDKGWGIRDGMHWRG